MAPFKSTDDSFSASKVSKVTDITFSKGIAGITTGTVSGTYEHFVPGNGYEYLIFTAPGSFTVTKSGLADIMIVGGGGGGSGCPPTRTEGGGGGGAGGVAHQYWVNLPSFPGTYSITIGAGGAGGNHLNPTALGSNGSPSTFSSPTINNITAPGGGRGGSYPLAYGADGGCGGGGGNGPSCYRGNVSVPGGIYHEDITFPSNATYLNYMGYPGGDGVTATSQTGGGGGGAGQAGSPSRKDISSGPGGNGGDGLSAFDGDNGVPTSYGEAYSAGGDQTVGHPSAPLFSPSVPDPAIFKGRYFGGGGGGSSYGAGGLGGGGSSPGFTGASGLVNTGGGGAGGRQDGYSGGSGGSGIAIIKYKTSS